MNCPSFHPALQSSSHLVRFCDKKEHQWLIPPPFSCEMLLQCRHAWHPKLRLHACMSADLDLYSRIRLVNCSHMGRWASCRRIGIKATNTHTHRYEQHIPIGWEIHSLHGSDKPSEFCLASHHNLIIIY